MSCGAGSRLAVEPRGGWEVPSTMGKLRRLPVGRLKSPGYESCAFAFIDRAFARVYYDESLAFCMCVSGLLSRAGPFWACRFVDSPLQACAWLYSVKP